jgi:uncharacterized protein (TIGR03435 family)
VFFEASWFLFFEESRMSKVILALLLSCSMAFVSAQQAESTFEVATVKENKGGDTNGMLSRPPGGRVNAMNMPVRFLISYAYALTPQQPLLGGPGWIDGARYDIVAKLEGNPPVVPPGSGIDPARLAMRSLLAERFKLKIHRETREQDIYALVLVKPGITGPALKPSTHDCAAAARAGARGAATAPDAPFCGVQGGPGRLRFGGLPASQLAAALSGQAGRMVVDRTGLTGSWEFVLSYAPEGADASDAPSFFTAIQEQLGLKFESTRGPVEVLVIDSVDRPVDD